MFLIFLKISLKRILRGGTLTETHINTNSFKINQRIKRMNVFEFIDYLIFPFNKYFGGGGASQMHTKIKAASKIINEQAGFELCQAQYS